MLMILEDEPLKKKVKNQEKERKAAVVVSHHCCFQMIYSLIPSMFLRQRVEDECVLEML